MRVDDYMRSKIFEITWRNLEIQFDDSVEDYRFMTSWRFGNMEQRLDAVDTMIGWRCPGQDLKQQG